MRSRPAPPEAVPPGELLTEAAPLDGDDAPGDGLRGGLRQAYLVCHREDRVDVVPLPMNEEITVGRSAEATIRVDSPRVSRIHARLRFAGGAIHVEDAGSRNGTRVNDEVIRGEARTLPTGGTLEIGPLQIFIARAERPLDYADRSRADAGAEGATDADDDDDGDDGDAADRGIVVADAAMRRVFQIVRRLAATSSTVLIGGETGVGKEVVAEEIHRLSARAEKPFVRLNCASMPEALLESELFGHERGAFSGADRRRVGHFESANGGSILLDEIGEMPLVSQAKLLRVLERHAVVRLGASSEIPVDVRILAATHRDLAAQVAAGQFRQDLYYRIATFTLEVPPLRERRAEVLLLADLFARRFAEQLRLPKPVLARDAVALLLAHAWPGNIRELRNALEHAVVLAHGEPLRAEHFPRALRPDAPVPSAPPVRDRLEEIERAAIDEAIAAEGGNHTRAAKRLGMSRRALLYKITKYKLRG